MSLAKPGDPYVTERGQVILREDAFDKPDTTIGPARAKTLTSSVRRSVRDLPTEGKMQTAIIVVLSYSILGLSENEIAHVSGASIEDVQRVKQLDAYQETFEMIFAELLSINSSSMRAKIAAFAPSALEGVMHLAANSKHDLTKLKANQDILDRSGLHPEALFGKNASDNAIESLNIVFQDGDDRDVNISVNMKKGK